MVCDVPFKIHPAMNFSSSGANMWFIEHFFCGGKELMISTRVFVVFLSNIIWASADTVNITRKIQCASTLVLIESLGAKNAPKSLYSLYKFLHYLVGFRTFHIVAQFFNPDIISSEIQIEWNHPFISGRTISLSRLINGIHIDTTLVLLPIHPSSKALWVHTLH